jgi:hypothetical protein
LIEPTASSSAALTPSRPTISAMATTPEAGVNDSSGAPTRTRPAKPGILFTERVSFPTATHWSFDKPNCPCW